MPPSSPIDRIWALVLLWKIRGKIIRTVLCCVVYDSCAQWYAHTHMNNSYIFACLLGLDFFLCVYLGFVYCVFFRVSLGHFVLVLLAFVVLHLVSLVLRQEIGWELGRTSLKWLILCRVGRKTVTQSVLRMPQYFHLLCLWCLFFCHHMPWFGHSLSLIYTKIEVDLQLQ